MNKITEYHYINDLGYKKKLYVYPSCDENKKYTVFCICLNNGETSFQRKMTLQEISSFLAQYNNVKKF